MIREYARSGRSRSLGKGPRCLDWIGLGAERCVHVPNQVRIDLGVDRPGLAWRDHFNLLTVTSLCGHSLAHVVVLLRRVNGCQRAGLSELDIVSEVELHLLEELQASHREISVEVRDVAPAGRADLPSIRAGRLGSDLATLKERDVVTQCREIEGGGRSRDSTANYQCLCLGHESSQAMGSAACPASR